MLEEAKGLMARTDTEPSHQSRSTEFSTVAVRKTRAPATYHFRKDSLTGQRITHCEYRQRKVKTAEKEHVHLDPEDDAAVSGMLFERPQITLKRRKP